VLSLKNKNESNQNNNSNEQKKGQTTDTRDIQELINSDQDDFNYQQMRHNNE
jgi:uncharacterized protein YpmS